MVWKHGLKRFVLPPVSGTSWWVVVTVTAVAAFVIAAFVSLELKGTEIHPDFREGYHPGAVNIHSGHGYVDDSGEFITAWPPGWSVFISPWVVSDAWGSVERLRVVSGLLAIVWVLTLAFLAKLVSPRISILIVLGLAVFWPPMWALGDPMGSDMLFATISTLSVYFLVRLYHLRPSVTGRTVSLTVGGGLLFAAAALTRTIGLAVAGASLVGIALGFRQWSIRRRGAVVLLSVVVIGLGITPWVLQYRKHTGVYGFTSNGLNSVRYGLERFQSFPLGHELKERSVQWTSYGDIWRDVRELSAADPLGAVHLVMKKIVDPWFGTTSRTWDRYLFAIQLPWLVLFVVASGRALWRWNHLPGDVMLLHAYVVALWLTAALVEPLLRYLAPGFPFVVMVVLWHVMDATASGARDGRAWPRGTPAAVDRAGSGSRADAGASSPRG